MGNFYANIVLPPDAVEALGGFSSESRQGEAELDADAAAGNAEALVTAFGVPRKARKVQAILDEEHTFAIEKHEQLVKELGLPVSCLGMGYEYLDRGEAPDGIARAALTLVMDGKSHKVR